MRGQRAEESRGKGPPPPFFLGRERERERGSITAEQVDRDGLRRPRHT